MCVCACVCVHLCACVCVHMRLTHACVYVCKCVCVCVHVYACVRVCLTHDHARHLINHPSLTSVSTPLSTFTYICTQIYIYRVGDKGTTRDDLRVRDRIIARGRTGGFVCPRSESRGVKRRMHYIYVIV